MQNDGLKKKGVERIEGFFPMVRSLFRNIFQTRNRVAVECNVDDLGKRTMSPMSLEPTLDASIRSNMTPSFKARRKFVDQVVEKLAAAGLIVESDSEIALAKHISVKTHPEMPRLPAAEGLWVNTNIPYVPNEFDDSGEF
jgi:hypothetical protein